MKSLESEDRLPPWIGAWLDAPERTTLVLSALTLLLFPPDLHLLKIIACPVLCGAMLIHRRWLFRPLPWTLLLFALLVSTVLFWPTRDNHHFLFLYWTGVIALALASDYRSVEQLRPTLAWNGRLLLGLAMFFATLSKFLWGEFLDGSFLYYQLLTDDRLAFAARLFGGVDPAVSSYHQALASSLSTAPPGTIVTLQDLPSLWRGARLMSYWTLLIEGGIALAFLMPRPRWLFDRRDLLLLLFILTTYPLTPVPGFATILTTMGFAQCDPRRRRTRLAYLMVFLIIPVITAMPRLLTAPLDYLFSAP